MKMPKVSKDPKGDHLVADVACKHGYLLVPANASRLHCINGTWDEVPECKGGLCWILRERDGGEREGGDD